MGASLATGLLVAAIGGAPASDGHGCHISTTAIIEAPLEDVHAVVAELARYREWFPAVRSSARVAEGEYEVALGLPWPIRNVRERLRVDEESGGDVSRVRWRQLEGDFVRNEGSWSLRRLGPARTELRYDNDVQLRRWVPAWLVRRAQRRLAPQMIGSIERRASARAAAREQSAREQSARAAR